KDKALECNHDNTNNNSNNNNKNNNNNDNNNNNNNNNNDNKEDIANRNTAVSVHTNADTTNAETNEAKETVNEKVDKIEKKLKRDVEYPRPSRPPPPPPPPFSSSPRRLHGSAVGSSFADPKSKVSPPSSEPVPVSMSSALHGERTTSPRKKDKTVPSPSMKTSQLPPSPRRRPQGSSQVQLQKLSPRQNASWFPSQSTNTSSKEEKRNDDDDDDDDDDDVPEIVHIRITSKDKEKSIGRESDESDKTRHYQQQKEQQKEQQQQSSTHNSTFSLRRGVSNPTMDDNQSTTNESVPEPMEKVKSISTDLRQDTLPRKEDEDHQEQSDDTPQRHLVELLKKLEERPDQLNNAYESSERSDDEQTNYTRVTHPNTNSHTRSNTQTTVQTLHTHISQSYTNSQMVHKHPRFFHDRIYPGNQGQRHEDEHAATVLPDSEHPSAHPDDVTETAETTTHRPLPPLPTKKQIYFSTRTSYV
ncbi:PHD zinc finger-containing protein, partial [Reticulomyxa filosa]